MSNKKTTFTIDERFDSYQSSKFWVVTKGNKETFFYPWTSEPKGFQTREDAKSFARKTR